MSDNGRSPQVPYQWVARLFQATPDAQQWEIRLTAIAQHPEGPREVCTMTIHGWEGGVELMRSLIPVGAQLAIQIATQKISGLITQV
jgi:hypothetical protein